jgi:hypothetical protein
MRVLTNNHVATFNFLDLLSVCDKLTEVRNLPRRFNRRRLRKFH